jgi:hypothetical protein
VPWQDAQVTFANAQREFETRLCLWANSEWEKEIAESFPNLRLFKSGLPWQTCQFLKQLTKSEQSALARALLERRWPDAADALDDGSSTEGVLLRSIRDDFFRIRGLYRHMQRLEKEREFTQARVLFEMIRSDAVKVAGGHFENDKQLRSRLDAVFEPIPSTFDEEVAAMELAGKKIEYVNKRTLMKAMKTKYLCAFENQSIVPHYADGGEPGFAFQMQCCGWILTTSFDFGRRENWIEYCHDIASEDTFEQNGPQGRFREFLRIGRNVSFCSWVGVDAVTQWGQLTKSEVEPACESAIKFCRQFFEVTPKLLKGLELEKITVS